MRDKISITFGRTKEKLMGEIRWSLSWDHTHYVYDTVEECARFTGGLQ